MKKAVKEAIEKALARKQKQLARVKYEIDIQINGYKYLVDGYANVMAKAKEANNRGDYKKALQMP